MACVVHVESLPGPDHGLNDLDDVPADGRAARSHRTRLAILDAMRSLHAEGDLRPTVPRIAARAGVSLRTVWQQFADREALLIEAVKRDREIQRSLVARIDPDQPLAARVEAFVAQRARVLEEMTPTWRAARVHQPFSDQLQRDRKRRNAGGRAEIEQVFAPELDQLPGAGAGPAGRLAARDQPLVVLGDASHRSGAEPARCQADSGQHFYRPACAGRVRSDFIAKPTRHESLFSAHTIDLAHIVQIS